MTAFTIPWISDFATEAADPARYAELPEDWFLAAADIVASSQFIADPLRYRDINFIAAAVIAEISATIRESGHEDFVASQFGGDGAIIAVPPEAEQAVRHSLAALSHWAETSFRTSLRVGLFPISALATRHQGLRVAMFDMTQGKRFGSALFLGDGAKAAEDWLKQKDCPHRLPAAAGTLQGLKGLSCRWRPIPARRGVILCLLADPIAPGEAGREAIAALLGRIEAVVPTSSAAPISADNPDLRPRLRPAYGAFRRDRLKFGGLRGWAMMGKSMIQHLLLNVFFRTGVTVGGMDMRRYVAENSARTDFRKIAGGLRLLLDLTEPEAGKVEALLAEFEAQGKIRYGAARTASTTLTCLITDIPSGRHIHFVDGSGIGYWHAAQALKGQSEGVREREPAA